MARVVGIVPAGIRLRTESVPGAGCAKSRGCGHSTTRRMGWVRRRSCHRRTRGQDEEDEQEDKNEAMLSVRKSAEFEQADGI